MIRGWHDVYVRFGSNTLKTFGAESDPGIVLKENDIFFIDIGPVWGETEGDGGDTFVVGTDAGMEQCAADAKKLVPYRAQEMGKHGDERQGTL